MKVGLPDEVVNGIEVWVYIGEWATWFILSIVQPWPFPNQGIRRN